MSKDGRTLREEARRAKLRIKSGFWKECQEDMDEHLEKLTGDRNLKKYVL